MGIADQSAPEARPTETTAVVIRRPATAPAPVSVSPSWPHSFRNGGLVVSTAAPEAETKPAGGYLDFSEAREKARSLKLFSKNQYQQWVKKNQDARLPLNPHLFYSRAWNGWTNFLGS